MKKTDLSSVGIDVEKLELLHITLETAYLKHAYCVAP